MRDMFSRSRRLRELSRRLETFEPYETTESGDRLIRLHVNDVDYFLSPLSVDGVPCISDDTAFLLNYYLKNMSADSDEKLFFELCREMEVDPQRKYSELSFGQQKKCLIATALALNTDYLLLDEPTNGLDIPSKTLFRQVIAKHANDNRTIIISTHQVKDVENLIDPIIILDHDEVLLKASFREITDRLYFDYGTEKDDTALYSEMIPGGYVNVTRNPEGLDSKVSIEVLFNTVMKNKETIKQLFG